MHITNDDIRDAAFWWGGSGPQYEVDYNGPRFWQIARDDQTAVVKELASWLDSTYIDGKGNRYTIKGWLRRARTYKVLLERNPGDYVHTSFPAIQRYKTDSATDFLAWLKAKGPPVAAPPVDVDEAPRTALNIAHSVLIKLGCTGYPAPGNYESYIERFDLKTEHPGNTVCYRDDCVVCREIRREVDEHGGQSDIGPAIAQAWAADYSARIKDNARA
jgi:hypothetical protein